MKKCALLVVLAMLLTFTACSKDAGIAVDNGQESEHTTQFQTKKEPVDEDMEPLLRDYLLMSMLLQMLPA